jgi:hypothetical protein
MISFSQSLCVPLENNSPFWAHLGIGKFDIPHTNKHDRSWLSRSISIKSDGVKLVYRRFIFTALLLLMKYNWIDIKWWLASTLYKITVVKELRSKMFGQHSRYLKAVFLRKTQISIVQQNNISKKKSIIHQYFFFFFGNI